MSAIITSKFRIHNATSFKEGFSEADPSKMYLFVGRPQPWANDLVPDTPKDNVLAENLAWRDMIAMKQIQQDDVSLAIRRINWTAGKYYDMYRHNYSGLIEQGVDYNTGVPTARASLFDANYYVINSNYEVYKCLNNKAIDNTILPASVEPFGLGGYAPFTTSDGYTWQYMYTVSPADIIKFASTDFIPVNTLTTSPTVGAPYYTQWQTQLAAADGSIDVIEIVNGGAAYTETPTIQIVGDGSDASATPIMDGGVIVGISITNPGTGYRFATINVVPTGAGGSGAELVAQIAPKGGHGKNAIEELGGYYTIMNVRLEYADGLGDFPVDNDYRRIGIIKDPYNYSTTTVSTATTLKATYSLTLNVTGTTPDFEVDEQIVSSGNGATATVVSWDQPTGVLRYIKTDDDNTYTFTNSAVITGGTSGCVATITGLGLPEVQPYSGDLIYFENRRPITRADDQIEDIKIIVEM